MAIRFDISPSACAGGGHFDVTTIQGAKSFTRRYHRDELLAIPTGDELKVLADVLIRLLVARLSTGSHAECLDRIHGLEIALQPRDGS